MLRNINIQTAGNENSRDLVLAAIDIGSNAARLLICRAMKTKASETVFIKLNLVRIPLQLGFDVFEQGYISAEKEIKLIDTLHSYKYLMRVYNVNHFEACATSAMREAGNSAEIISRVKEITGIDIKIISGREEAEIIFENHIEKYLDKNHPYLYIDVGGGSTELTLYNNSKPVFEESFDVGTIRMLKKKIDENEWLRFKEYIKSETRRYGNLVGIGSGGNINKISSMSRIKLNKPIESEVLLDYYEELSKMNVEERMIEYGFREDRAEVILPALQIYNYVMKWAHINKIYVPRIGLADGLIRKLYKNRAIPV